MRSQYERRTELDDLLYRARTLAVRTLIVDIEPLVSWWDNDRASLDWGVKMLVGRAGTLPALRALVFATNSLRRPSALPAGRDFEVRYLASAGKPVLTAPYRDLPRPGAVLGDQVATDGLLAWRLGFAFLHYQPERGDVPLGPRLLHRVGRLAVPLLFTRQEEV
jgi:hypothetical protein